MALILVVVPDYYEKAILEKTAVFAVFQGPMIVFAVYFGWIEFWFFSLLNPLDDYGFSEKSRYKKQHNNSK